MPADQVIVIRHAEKPTAHPKRHGVAEDGTPDKESLTVRGWRHAGSLAAVFAAEGAHPKGAALGRPDRIFASAVGRKRVAGPDGRTVTVGSHSRRPLQTVSEMAARLGLVPDTSHHRGEEAALAADAIGREGTVLICWQHEDIPAIGRAIAGDHAGIPDAWPGDRYDIVWVFDRKGTGWTFRTLAHPRLLAAEPPVTP
jgi:broad specificity phosphatase PhoE